MTASAMRTGKTMVEAIIGNKKEGMWRRKRKTYNGFISKIILEKLLLFFSINNENEYH